MLQQRFAHKGTLSRVKRRFVTLMEIMIVMILIALVLGALAYNYQGTLEKGKLFKAERAKEKIENILNLKLAQDPGAAAGISENWKQYLIDSSMVVNPQDLSRDPWGYEYTVEVDSNGNVVVSSQGLNTHLRPR